MTFAGRLFAWLNTLFARTFRDEDEDIHAQPEKPEGNRPETLEWRRKRRQIVEEERRRRGELPHIARLRKDREQTPVIRVVVLGGRHWMRVDLGGFDLFRMGEQGEPNWLNPKVARDLGLRVLGAAHEVRDKVLKDKAEREQRERATFVVRRGIVVPKKEHQENG